MIKSSFFVDKGIRLPIIKGIVGAKISLSGLAAETTIGGYICVIPIVGPGVYYKQLPADGLKHNNWSFKTRISHRIKKSLRDILIDP